MRNIAFVTHVIDDASMVIVEMWMTIGTDKWISNPWKMHVHFLYV